MPRSTREARVTWEGNVARSVGLISGSSGAFAELPFTLATRITPRASEGKTTPEELLAAAHAGCYAMSLAGELTSTGTPPERLEVAATCVLDEVEGKGHRVVRMELTARGNVPGADAEAFAAAAKAADDGCPFSALARDAGAEVAIDAALAG